MKVIVENDVMDRAWMDWKLGTNKGIKNMTEFTLYLDNHYGVDITETFLKDHNTWELEITNEKLAALFLLRYS